MGYNLDMEIPKRVLRGGLSLTALGLAANFLGCNGRPLPLESSPTKPATPIQALSSDKRRLSSLLENFNTSFEAFPLERNHNLSYPPFDVLNLASGYQVLIHLEGLNYWANYCQTRETTNPINILFFNGLNQNKPYEIVLGKQVAMLFGIEGFYESAAKDAASMYGLLPSDKILDNEANLWLNIRLIDGLCVSTRVAKMPNLQSGVVLDTILDNATKEANSFEEALLEGSRPLIAAIHRS